MPSTSLMTLAGQYPKPFSFAYTRSWGGFCKHNPHPRAVHFTQAHLSGALSWLGPEELNFQPHTSATHPWLDTDVLKLCSLHHQADQHYTLETRQIYCFFLTAQIWKCADTSHSLSVSKKRKILIWERQPPPPPPTQNQLVKMDVCAACAYMHAGVCLPVCGTSTGRR